VVSSANGSFTGSLTSAGAVISDSVDSAGANDSSAAIAGSSVGSTSDATLVSTNVSAEADGSTVD
jgi:hypothetical protein